MLFMGLQHILSEPRVRAEGPGDFGFEGRGGAGVCAGLALPELDFMFCWTLTAVKFPRRCSDGLRVLFGVEYAKKSLSGLSGNRRWARR